MITPGIKVLAPSRLDNMLTMLSVEILKRRSPAQCPAFEDWLEILQSEYEANLLPIDEAVSARWGRLMARCNVSVIDGLLPASALTHGLTVATRNGNDFKGTGVKWVNSFLESKN